MRPISSSVTLENKQLHKCGAREASKLRDFREQIRIYGVVPVAVLMSDCHARRGNAIKSMKSLIKTNHRASTFAC